MTATAELVHFGVWGIKVQIFFYYLVSQREDYYYVLESANLHLLHPKKFLVRQVFLIQFSVVDRVNEEDVFSVKKIFLLLQLQLHLLWKPELVGESGG